jgi:glycosyltransferase involved in cell wall biosynthesis
MPELSVIIPVMNEEDNIYPLIFSMRLALERLDYEIIFVDDGSTDATGARIKTLEDERIILIELKRNYGQSTAMAAGIDYAKGKYIAFLDGDLQNDPEDIPILLKKLKNEEWDMVAGNRKERKDGTFLRKIPSKIANILIRGLTKVSVTDSGCTLKVLTGELAGELNLHGELHRFIPVIASFNGARITQMDVRHHSRRNGKSKYGLNRTFRVASDLMMLLFFGRYGQKPMHLFGTMGIICLFFGISINLYLLILKTMGHNIWGKPLLILGTILLLGGIQLITIGILTEIIFRIYREASRKTTYRIRKIYLHEQMEGLDKVIR